jgi:PAS domain S-box-containing protein
MDPIKANILIVDDRVEELLALETVLADLRQNIVKAQSGKEALRHLLHQEFALVILDVNMPGLDGFETAALIRQRRYTEHIPIIFKTAGGQSDLSLARSYALGAVDYIQAPIVPEVLKAKVSVFVELHKKTEQVKRQAEELRLLELRDHERRLAETHERLEIETKRNLFFVLSIDLLAVAGFDGYFKQLSPSWERTLGFKEHELKQRPFIELVHAEDQTATIEQLEKLKHGGSIAYFENRFYCNHNGYKWLGWTAAPSATDELIYLSARDMTERKLAEDSIRGLKDELEQRVLELTDINQELESFTYSIAHDLRAPLRAMQGFSKALVDDYGHQMEATGRDYAKRVIAASENMDELIQDLLNYSRLGRAELQLEPVDLGIISDEMLDYLSSELQEKKAEVTIEKPLPKVLAHRATLLQILTNLLSNATKFVAPQTVPKITVWAEKKGPCVRVSMQDNGIGIAPEHHSRIFRVFERLHTKEAYPGTGIGLAIVRKGIERMNGRVGVESKPAEGSRFWIELPAAEQQR